MVKSFVGSWPESQTDPAGSWLGHMDGAGLVESGSPRPWSPQPTALAEVRRAFRGWSALCGTRVFVCSAVVGPLWVWGSHVRGPPNPHFWKSHHVSPSMTHPSHVQSVGLGPSTWKVGMAHMGLDRLRITEGNMFRFQAVTATSAALHLPAVRMGLYACAEKAASGKSMSTRGVDQLELHISSS